ncbi:CD1375 family protein [Enterococcus hirae]|nr:CD1375 family protein [Enterococcus hirae]MCO5490679.1 CD1375 family protein [Enterococcus hirae]
MENIYADLIKKGKKTIDDVPKILKKKVQAILAQDATE